MNALVYYGLAALDNPPRCRPARRTRWENAGVEPSLNDLLSDPLTHAVMARDKVSPNALMAVVKQARQSLKDKKQAA